MSEWLPNIIDRLEFDIEPASLSGPLAQFQAVTTDRSGTLKLVNDLARIRYPAGVGVAVARRFDKFWNDLESTITTLAAQPSETDTSNERTIELLQEQVADLGHLIRQLVGNTTLPIATNIAPSAVPPASDASLDDLVGVWRTNNGSHVYARNIAGALVAPYCYHGNHELTGVYRDWRLVSDYWYTRFSWVAREVNGFAFYRLENPNRLSGRWWTTDGIPDDLVVMPPPEGGVRAVWTKLSKARIPAWAQNYFAEFERDALRRDSTA